MTRGKIHKYRGKAADFTAVPGPDGEKLYKNFANILCKLFMFSLAPRRRDCYTIWQNPKEKGGDAMMMNWRNFDDVDDLIFADAGWEHSER